MINTFLRVCFAGIIVFLMPFHALAQNPATIKEYEKTLTTYPFSEPDPIPNQGNIYPYFRFDGFTDQPVQKKWKVIELDNDFIKVLIMPQIGGKIWTAIDKKNGKPFIYDNDAIKFRDIAMRGPWTSGGIEANFGIVGHTPGVATPVNYLTKKNEDGSVSCIISLLDLLTQTRWNMEIKLPKDKAYFITHVFWHNSTSIDQPYYSWMNLGEKVSDSLEYIEPGNHYLGHDGSVHNWPYNQTNQKNISIYLQNDFGGSKSYHVTGVYSKYFGTFWQKENFGMIHYAPRQNKIGKKVWIWGLSRQGMIWENILTDHSGQYSELQSGRLYNQNAPRSIFSPFKQFTFTPYNTDSWSEYWYPFQNTGGVTTADLNGVIHLQQHAGGATLFISPVSYINDTLKVLNNKGDIIYQKSLKLPPLKSFKQDIAIERNEKIGQITLAGSTLNLQDSSAKILDRPLKPFAGFDWASSYGLYLRGQYEAGTRHYSQAEKYIQASLKKESYFMPALTEMSYLQYRKMNYDSAFYYARKALSIDTYDPAANYYYGLAALKLNKWYDAEDGFEMAIITPQFRAAAYTELGKMKLQKKNYKKAFQYASNSLTYNAKNLTALQLEYLATRLMGKQKQEETIKNKILKLDPLNNFVRFETYWQKKDNTSRQEFTSLIRDELPQQTYLHLADWYMQLNLTAEAESILQGAPQKDDEIKYWMAYLHRNDLNAKELLDTADAGSPLFVFPFRQESAKVMEWAMQHTNNWRPKYYLALIENFRDHKTKALQLLKDIKKPIHFAPFYVTRARLRDSSDVTNKLNDYRTAASLNTKDWRYGNYLVGFLLTQKQDAEALKVIKPYYKKDPGNYIVGILYTRCLMLNNDYNVAETILDSIHILPYEGATSGHKLYKQTKLMLALQFLQKHKYKTALQKVKEARKWPERLGVGKPYPDMINDSLENSIERLIHQAAEGNHLSNKDINDYKIKVKAINEM